MKSPNKTPTKKKKKAPLRNNTPIGRKEFAPIKRNLAPFSTAIQPDQLIPDIISETPPRQSAATESIPQ